MSAFAGHPFNAYFAAAFSADACAACSHSACGDHADQKAFSVMDAMLLMASIFVCIALLCRTLLGEPPAEHQPGGRQRGPGVKNHGPRFFLFPAAHHTLDIFRKEIGTC